MGVGVRTLRSLVWLAGKKQPGAVWGAAGTEPAVAGGCFSHCTVNVLYAHQLFPAGALRAASDPSSARPVA